MKMKLDQLADLNTNLYELSSISKGEFSLKLEVIEEILDNMNWEGNSDFSLPLKSNDWYSPDEPGEVNLEASGSIDINRLVQKFGNISQYDLENIIIELKDNDTVKDFLKNILDEFKDPHIESFQVNYKIFIVNNMIKINSEAEQILIYE